MKNKHKAEVEIKVNLEKLHKALESFTKSYEALKTTCSTFDQLEKEMDLKTRYLKSTETAEQDEEELSYVGKWVKGNPTDPEYIERFSSEGIEREVKSKLERLISPPPSIDGDWKVDLETRFPPAATTDPIIHKTGEIPFEPEDVSFFVGRLEFDKDTPIKFINQNGETKFFVQPANQSLMIFFEPSETFLELLWKMFGE